MSFRELLGQNITEESPAYGFTLVIWGSGTLLLSAFNLHEYSILMYVLGGILGFTVLSILAFGGLMRQVRERDMREPAASMIHIIGAFGAVALSYLLINNIMLGFEKQYVALATGFSATVSYNLLLLLEHLLYEDIYKIERGETEN